MNFANNLKRLRNQRSLTQKEFAEIIGVSPSTVTMYEIGQREPNFTLLDKMATYFDVSTDYLLGRIKPPQDQYFYDEELSSMINRIDEIQDELESIKSKINQKFNEV